MDPVSALGVASAAVAFIDFAIGIVHEIHANCGTGKRLTQRSFETVINDLLSWNLSLDQDNVAESDSDLRVREHFKALQHLLSECSATARKLIEALEELKPKSPVSKWDCFCAALKMHWGADRLEDLRLQIESFRSQLSLRMLGYINAKLDTRYTAQNRNFDAIAHQNSKIVDIMAIHQRQLAAVAGQEKCTQTAVVEALAILKSGEMRRLSVDEGPQSDGSRAGVGYQVGPGVSTYVLSMGDGITSSTGEHKADNTSFDEMQKHIMGLLHFPEIQFRFESVKHSHRRTLDWVFGEETERADEGPTFTWSNFATWLQSDSRCYWLRGKAGSGKSTLMKYLYQDERTRLHLLKWSEGRRLITPGFFFWYLGTTLQKSQAGLFRALLYNIFQQWPPLILEIMPELCEPYAGGGVSSQEEPAMETLWNWFRRLQEVTSQVSICIFIDGLDEYVGDHSAMAELFLDMANACPFIKFVVSSRPINSCVDAFQNSPSLRLENLNRTDIRTYVEDKLGPKLDIWGRGKCPELREEIVVKSMGVFLWVHLVVHSLLQGLRDGDTTSELATRLRDLPSDLEQLYVHMLDRIPTAYQPQASQIFQLVLTRDQVLDRLLGERRQRLSALQFSYAIEDAEDDERQLEAGPTTSLMQSQRVAHTDARIRSRCFGIVEVVYRDRTGAPIMHPEVPSFFDTNDPRFHSVEYMHRTASEFLTQGYVEAKLRDLLRGQAFEPLERLFRSCVVLARTSEPVRALRGDLDDVMVWGRLVEGLVYAKEAEEKGRPLVMAELELLDSAYSWQWENSEIYYKRMQDAWVSIRRSGHWFRRIPERHDHDNAISLTETIAQQRFNESPWETRQIYGLSLYDFPYCDAIGEDMSAFLDDETLNFSRVGIMFGLHSWVRQDLLQHQGVTGNTMNYKPTRLLQFLVLGISGTVVGLQEFMATSPAPICETLLAAGADPNTRWAGHDGGTLWTHLLFYYATRIEDSRSIPDVATMEAFVRNGADLTVYIVFRGTRFSPSGLVRSLLKDFPKFAKELTTYQGEGGSLIILCEDCNWL
ncbi:hypothetical protein FJTKL_13313 [Diaporthe vaccinii]|uniref:NACHT domain-containing protein n=1 Tax=Diaporthe vaccinii TaxID=105482 RepID=A0ABR4EBC7_9PEZI